MPPLGRHVPSGRLHPRLKSLLHTADVRWEHFLDSEAEGIHCENPRLDFGLVNDRKNKIVDKHSKGVNFLMRKNKVDLIPGYGRLAGPGKIEVTAADGSKKIVETKNIVLATGSSARMTPWPRAGMPKAASIDHHRNPEPAHHSENAGDPRRGRRGRRVRVVLPTALDRKSSIFEENAAHRARRGRRSFEGTGKGFQEVQHSASRPAPKRSEGIEKTATGVRFTAVLANGTRETVEADAILIAVGRKPNTENIGLEGTRVQLDRGFIKVDPFQKNRRSPASTPSAISSRERRSSRMSRQPKA